jgi:hypothetical protein
VHLFPQIDRPENLASTVQAGLETYKYCFPILYLISIAFGSVAIIVLLFLKDLEKYMNDHVAVCCEKEVDVLFIVYIEGVYGALIEWTKNILQDTRGRFLPW